MTSQINYNDLTNQQLYTTAFTSKRGYKLFITIPHTDIDQQDLLDKIKQRKHLIYSRVAQEHHEDGDTHIHILATFSQQEQYGTFIKIIQSVQSGKRIGGAINIQIPKSADAINKYLEKEHNYVEYGDISTVKIGKAREELKGYMEAIQLSKEGQVAEALELLYSHQPRDMLINGGNIRENLTSLNLTRERFPITEQTKENTQLKVWQSQLLELVQSQPKARRIIWVEGDPSTGKSFMFDYLNNLSNFKYGLYNAGQCVSLDNLAYNYDEEGIIAWDFPLNYDFEKEGMEGHIANVIEKFSDFGQKISSRKYKGSTKIIRGHCLVFSNKPPLDNLRHRDIKHIKTTKEFLDIKQNIIVHKNDKKKNEILPDTPETVKIPLKNAEHIRVLKKDKKIINRKMEIEDLLDDLDPTNPEQTEIFYSLGTELYDIRAILYNYEELEEEEYVD